MLGGVALVHAEQVRAEQRRLVAAGAGPDLEDGVLLVGRVLGEEMQAQLLEKLAPAVIGLVELVLGQLPQLFVGRGVVGERNQLAPLGLGLAVLADCVDDRIQLRELLRQLHAGRLIDALTELGLERCPALNELVELLGGDGCHGKDIRARRSKRKTGVRAARARAATFATLTGARVQLVGFAQPRIAHFDPPQTIAVRRRDERDIVQAGTRRTPDRIRQQSDGAIHRPWRSVRQIDHGGDERNRRAQGKQRPSPQSAPPRGAARRTLALGDRPRAGGGPAAGGLRGHP